MATYIHELRDWPKFRWDDGRLAAPLSAARHLQGRLVGQMEALGFRVREEAVLRTLTEDVLKSSEIEGERAGREPGSLVGRASARNRYRRVAACGPSRRRRRRDDAGRDAALRSAADGGPSLRLARVAVPDW